MRNLIHQSLPRLAEYIVARTDWIIERWISAINRESDIPSAENLTRPQLVDHLPSLLHDLAERLKNAGIPQPQEETRHAHTHGVHRWEQGYDLAEVVREEGLVRQIVLGDCFDAFQSDESAFDAAARSAAAVVVEKFFTDMAVESAGHFAAEKDKAIRAVEQNSMAILQSALDAIIVMGSDGRVREWNPAAEALFGYSRAEAVGAELASLIIPAELREQHRRGVSHYLRTGEGPLLGRRIEVSAVKSDGSRIIAELAITPYHVRDETLFTGSLRDITARRADEEASQRLAAIVQSTADAIISTDLNGGITSWNESAEQLFGYGAEDAIGRSINLVIPPEGQDEDASFVERIRNGERIMAFETQRRRKDGRSMAVSLTLSPIFDNHGRVVGASRIVRDITEPKRIEEELRRQKEAAENANRAKDRFLATLSHELRTPLNPVLMWACATIENENLDPELHEGLQMICRNVQMEARMIDDLLDLTRVTRGKLKLQLQACAADELLEHALQIVRSPLTPKNLRISVDLAATNHRIFADPTRIEQVFWNLLNNAQKFTPDKGEIVVRSYDAAPGVLALVVLDSGPGIDPEMMPKLFQAFEQGPADTRGLGLGLAICHAIVELHGGKISGKNRDYRSGAEFKVEFNTIDAMTADESHPCSSETAVVRVLRILIVEDHEHTAAVMRRLLEREGHEVQVAVTVREALERLHALPIDLLVSDLGLPDGNGFQVMRELAKISTAKGIAVSGYGMEHDIERSSRAGFSAHLTKPIDIEKLKQTIQQVTAA